eukprot:TRINITY_DN20488_c1_g2_i1.p1 TRINITY_DN20488_c1_g2~~TRINITY_DN20488_c1_g2_i1.p1  ORF type:complete len:2317 (+),score=571.89 TRINITY_DN20488_c1_g2_i1:93-7043(+)
MGELAVLDVEKPLFLHGPSPQLADESEGPQVLLAYSSVYDVLAIVQADGIALYKGSEFVENHKAGTKANSKPLLEISTAGTAHAICCDDESGPGVLCVALEAGQVLFFGLEAAASGKVRKVHAAVLEDEEVSEVRWRAHDVLCLCESGRVHLVDPLRKSSQCIHDVVDFFATCVATDGGEDVAFLGGCLADEDAAGVTLWGLDIGSGDGWPVTFEAIPEDYEEQFMAGALRGVRLLRRAGGKRELACLFLASDDQGPMTLQAIFALADDSRTATLKAVSVNEVYVEEEEEQVTLQSVWIPEWSMLLMGCSCSSNIILLTDHPAALKNQDTDCEWAVLAPPEGKQLCCPMSSSQDAETWLRGLCLIPSFQGSIDRKGGSLEKPPVVLVAASDGTINLHYVDHHLQRPSVPDVAKAGLLDDMIAKLGDGGKPSSSSSTGVKGASPFVASTSSSPFGASAAGSALFGGTASAGSSGTSAFGATAASAKSPFGDTSASPFGGAAGTSSSPFGSSTAPGTSLFSGAGTGGSLFGGSAGTSASPFGGAAATSSSPFGGGTIAGTSASPFGSSSAGTSSSPFGGGGGGASSSGGSSAFGGKAATSSSPFGNATASSSSPFGGSAATSSSPFGSTATNSDTKASSSSLFGGGAGPSSSPFGSTSGSASSPFGGGLGTSGGLFGSAATSSSPFSSAAGTSSSSASKGSEGASGLFGGGAGGGLFGSAASSSSTGGVGAAGASTGSAAAPLFGSAGISSSPSPAAAAAETPSKPAAEAPAPGGGKSGGMTKEWCREKITEIYTEKNPAKVGEIENLLVKYVGKENVLYEKICKKYDVAVESPEGGSEATKAAAEDAAKGPTLAAASASPLFGAAAGSSSASSGSLFGGASGSSLFGSAAASSSSTASSGSSLFGAAASTSSGTSASLFGGTASSGSSLFGAEAGTSSGTSASALFGGDAKPSSSLFSSPSSASGGGSLFGSTAATGSSLLAATSSASSATSALSSSLFGGNASSLATLSSSTASSSGSGSLFGSTAAATGSSLLGATSESSASWSSSSLFGGTSTSASTSGGSGSLFGGTSATSGSSLFGSTSASAGSASSVLGATSSSTGSAGTSASLFGGTSTPHSNAKPGLFGASPATASQAALSKQTSGAESKVHVPKQAADAEGVLKALEASTSSTKTISCLMGCFNAFERALKDLEKSSIVGVAADLYSTVGGDLSSVSATTSAIKKSLNVADDLDRPKFTSDLAWMQSDTMQHYFDYASKSEGNCSGQKLESIRTYCSKIQESLSALESDMSEKFKDKIDWERTGQQEARLVLPSHRLAAAEAQPQEAPTMLPAASSRLPGAGTLFPAAQPSSRRWAPRQGALGLTRPPNPLKKGRDTAAATMGSALPLDKEESRARSCASLRLATNVPDSFEPEGCSLWFYQSKAQQERKRTAALQERIVGLSEEAAAVTGAEAHAAEVPAALLPSSAQSVSGPVRQLRKSLYSQLRTFGSSSGRRRVKRLDHLSLDKEALEVCTEKRTPAEIDTPTFGKSRKDGVLEGVLASQQAGGALGSMMPPPAVPKKSPRSRPTAAPADVGSLFGGSGVGADGTGLNLFGTSSASSSSSFFGSLGTTSSSSGGLFGGAVTAADAAAATPKPKSLERAPSLTPSLAGDEASTAKPADAAGATASAGKSVVDEYRDRIKVVYTQHNPSKLGEVDNLLTKNAGKEHELYLRVCKKYNVTPQAQYTAPASEAGAATATAAAGGLFGAASTPGAASSGGGLGLFGAPAGSSGAAATGGGLFGASAASTGGGLFGASASTSGAAATGGGLFGASAASAGAAATGGGLFGASAASTGSLFGGAAAAAAPVGAADPVQAYKELMVQIYQQHNPTKVSEIDTLMTKYKGQERTMYLKICKKYNVQPKPEDQVLPGQAAALGGAFGAASTGGGGLFGGAAAGGAAATGGLFGAAAATSGGGLFGAPASTGSGGLFGAASATTGGGLFGSAAASTGGGGLFGSAPAASSGGFGGGFGASTGGGLFGSAAAATGSAFGSPAPSGMFGGAAPTSAFGQPAAPASSPFGQPAPQATPFGAAPAQANPFGGGIASMGAAPAPANVVQEYGQRITQIYQHFNPSKLNEVANLLAKNAGKEHDLYLRICKKYNVPPQPPVAGAAPAGGANPFGGGMQAGFGGAPAGSPFGGGGAPAAGGFGGNASPFGAAPAAAASPFGGSTQPAFGSTSALGGAASPFGASPFGGAAAPTAAAASPFGGAAGVSPFGGSAVAAGGGFGAAAAQAAASPFGGGGVGGGFGGAAASPFGGGAAASPFGGGFGGSAFAQHRG